MMAAYLIIDVDDLLQHLEERGVVLDIQTVAHNLLTSAALAAGLRTSDLHAIAVADWNRYRRPSGSAGVSVQQVFAGENYDLFNIPRRTEVTEGLLFHYFGPDQGPVDDLIIASSREDVLALVSRVPTTGRTRIRVWGDEPPADLPDVIFQPLEVILGIPSKSVALYIDFENISISLSEQGYSINIDDLLAGMARQARSHGQVVHMAAYAPWGQRGSLAPLVDHTGREVSDEVPGRLARANIDPVFSLPGKNSADMRIAKDVLDDSARADSADVFIIASGDRDFNEVFSAVRTRNKQVIVWGVRGSTSRLVESNPALHVEYVEDFCNLQRHADLFAAAAAEPDDQPEFRPSQWSSAILQLDHLLTSSPVAAVPLVRLIDRLIEVRAVPNPDRGSDLIAQAVSRGILELDSDEMVALNTTSTIVQKTRLIRDRIVHRVANTLHVRGWEYVNYGFLLKGIGMDHGLTGPGLNTNDTWRSEWVDALVREDILTRELVPHRHNPDDLVPVIKLPDQPTPTSPATLPVVDRLEIERMVRRIIVSVEQFTSFRGFAWCPLGSLHRRLRGFDPSTTFQQAVEELQEDGAVSIDEYENPQSVFKTKGISLMVQSPRVTTIIAERNAFVRALLQLYDERRPISRDALQEIMPLADDALDLWISIMLAENVLKAVPGQQDLYSLFRTHHTVCSVAGDLAPGDSGASDDDLLHGGASHYLDADAADAEDDSLYDAPYDVDEDEPDER